MSELKRWHQYHPQTGEPVMCLAPKVDRQQRTCYVIRLQDAHLITDEMFLRQYVMAICTDMQLGLATRERFAAIRSQIEDGLDELVKMKPRQAVYDDAPKVVGEGEIQAADGSKIGFEVTDEWRREVSNAVH